MKNTLKFLSFLLIISFLFVSCEKDEPQEDEYYILDITVENGNGFDIDEVQVKLSYDSQDDAEDTAIIARSAYNRGNFKINLPKKIDEKYLIDILERFHPEESLLLDNDGDSLFVKNPFQVSDETVKISLNRTFFQAYKSNQYVGDIHIKYKDGYRLGYVNNEVKVTGHFESSKYFTPYIVSYDLDFNKGWNIFKYEKTIDDEWRTDYTISHSQKVECSFVKKSE